MKKALAFFLLLLLVVQQVSFACTTFFINKNGQMVFGRNYDWVSSSGMVCTNLRGLRKHSLPSDNGKVVNWVSKYGSISFNQYGKETPTGGMNEKGLVVELMWADGTQYPKADNRGSMGLLQWIQYQLDNHSTIDEIIASDEKIRISQDNPPCHFLVADAGGKSATIEFYNGKLVLHKGNDLPFSVLTNNTYKESVSAAKSAKISEGNTNFSFQNNSIQRFTKACSMVQQYQQTDIKKPIVEYAFDILNNVAQKDFTVWSIVYDITNKQIQFRTADYKDIKTMRFDSFDFSCTATSLSLNMNQALKGDVRKNFVPFTKEINREIMQKSIDESKSQVQISNETRDKNLAYAAGVRCN